MFVLYILVTGVAAAYCLLAVWVAIGRGHWFARACVFLIALALLVPIRAYEPLILFGMTSMLLVGGWSVIRGLEAIRKPSAGGESKDQTVSLRFQLRDVLLSCAVAAAASWMISVLVAKKVQVDWQGAGGTAALLAGVASLAVCVVRYRGWWWRFPLLAVSVFGAALCDALILDCWLLRSDMLDMLDRGLPPPPIYFPIVWCSFHYGGVALFSLFIAAIVAGAVRTWHRRGLSVAMRIAAISLLVGPAFFLGWVYLRMLDVPQWSPGDANRPKVLPRIFELARAAEKAPLPAQADAIYAELFGLLEQPSFVIWPKIRPSVLELNSTMSVPRNLARGLQARSNALQARERYDEAADQCLAVLRMAPMLDAEGIAMHRWESEALRHMGHAWLAKYREKLSPEKAEAAAELILKIADSRESMEATMLRDKIWNDRFTWRDMLRRAVVVELQGMEWPEPMERETEGIAAQEQCYARLLALDLLIRVHRAEHGEWPETLAAVVQGDNQNLLIDPYSDAPFIYRFTDHGFVLYSVGKNGIDDYGTFTNTINYMGSSRKSYDLDVDTMTRP